jgi:hypothetical protein
MDGRLRKTRRGEVDNRFAKPLQPNDGTDLDLVVSYDKPYWPDAPDSRWDNSRLGSLRNGAGIWLTATSYRRSQKTYPAPANLVLPHPRSGNPESNYGCWAWGDDPDDMYCFVESITSLS